MGIASNKLTSPVYKEIVSVIEKDVLPSVDLKSLSPLNVLGIPNEKIGRISINTAKTIVELLQGKDAAQSQLIVRKTLIEKAYGVMKPADSDIYLRAVLQICSNSQQMAERLLGAGVQIDKISDIDIAEGFVKQSQAVMKLAETGKLTKDEAEIQIGLFKVMKDLLIISQNKTEIKEILDQTRIGTEDLIKLSEVMNSNKTREVINNCIVGRKGALAKVEAVNQEGEIIVDADTIRLIRETVERKRPPFSELWSSVTAVFSGEKTLDEKIKDVLGKDFDAGSGSIEKRGAIFDPLQAKHIAGAA
jgi:hypothetical protein